MLGDTNPERTIKEWMQEQLELSYLGGTLQQIQADASGALQKAAQEMAQQMVQQIMQQAQAQQGQGGGGEEMGPPPGQGPQPEPFGPPGMEGGVEGGMFNPAEGGTPPAGANPGATFEGQMGQTRTGEPVAG